jgi:protocatechuate 4,5-dioxygenase beta chain
MAHVIGGLTTSHIPSVGNALARNLHEDPYWKPFFDAYPPIHAWLDEKQPDIAVVIYNDHGLNFFLDKMPTFAIGAAHTYTSEDEGWGIPVTAPYNGATELSWHIINSLVAEEFDICSCQEMTVDHGFTVPMQLFWNTPKRKPVRVVPISINTVQHPIPSPRRCYKFGQALGRALSSFPTDEKIVILGTGGLSHQLDGKRAGFINKKFDLMCMEKIVSDPEALASLSAMDLVREAGAQGAEFILWLAMRGALQGQVNKLLQNYHIPISNTGAGTMLLENVE